jgi:hypothetical protein
MPYNNISAAFTAAQKTAIKTAAETIKTNVPTLVNLSMQERKKLRKVGARAGYLKDVLDGSKANPTAISSSISIPEFEKDTLYFSDMSEMVALLKTLLEALEDTMIAVGSEAIRTADQCYANLKANAKGNANVKAAVDKIGYHFKGQGKKKAKPEV